MLDDTLRNDLLQEAYRRGSEYLLRWSACAPTTFAAIMDTLGYADDPVVQEIWKSTIGLTGGTGNLTVGTCGAVASAAAAISLSFGYNKEDVEDLKKMMTVNAAVAHIGQQVKEVFGGIRCEEIQFNNWGKAFEFSNREALGEFMDMASNERGKPRCQDVTAAIARMAVEKIMELNPQFIKR